MLKKVKLKEAIGAPLAHALTRVVPGHFKGQAFGRGHIIQEEDIPLLRSMGKEHVYVMTLEEGEVHEEDAAVRIAQCVAGPGFTSTKPREGKVSLLADRDGLLRINVAALEEINLLGDIIVSTLHDGTICKQGSGVAGMRIIPLAIAGRQLEQMEEIARRCYPVIGLAPLTLRRIGLVITGNEVFNGVIQDGFSPILHRKIEALGGTVAHEVIVPDDEAAIAQAIRESQSAGSEVILCCSGMSVDPDDVTPSGIRNSGAKIAFYGLPVLPGAMFLYARLGQTPILGVPACVLHMPTTAFDLLLPRVLAGEELTFAGTRHLGHGGLCLGCKQCAFPICPFGK